MADIRNFIGFAQNETLIKEYDGLRMYYPVRAKIGLAATSKRFIAYSTVKSFFDIRTESLYQQVNIRHQGYRCCLNPSDIAPYRLF